MQRPTGFVMVLLAATGFGTIGIFGKLATAAGLNNPTFLSFRFALATAILLGYLRVENHPTPSRRDVFGIFLLGIPYATLTAAYFWGLLSVPAGLATITLYTYPIYVFVASAMVLGERVTPLKAVALVASLTGIGVIVGLDTTGADPVGIALVLAAALAYAVYTMGSRVAVDSIEADQLATGAMAVTMVVFVAYGLGTDTLVVPSSIEQWGIILGITVVGTVLPIWLFVNGLKTVEATQASIVTTAEPVVTVTLGVLVLGEQLTASVLVGGGLVLFGVLLIQYDRVERAPAISAD